MICRARPSCTFLNLPSASFPFDFEGGMWYLSVFDCLSFYFRQFQPIMYLKVMYLNTDGNDDVTRAVNRTEQIL